MSPAVLALFDKRFAGDDALLELAAARFREAGMGLECHPGSPEELEHLLGFRPARETPVWVHLRRDIDLLSCGARRDIVQWARRFGGRVGGFVVHDPPDMAVCFDACAGALRALAQDLRGLPGAPCLCMEYAAGCDPPLFVEVFRAAGESEHVGCCLDIGHLGLWQVRRTFAQLHPGRDICALRPGDSELPALVADVSRAVHTALPQVLHTVESLGSLVRPLHMHLHDAHPLSTFSLYGIADHLSFFERVPLPFAVNGKDELEPLFGPAGLAQIVSRAIACCGTAGLSLTLEIHPREGHEPLAEPHTFFFRHWRDITNAERTNFWLSTLVRNYQALMDIVRRCGADGRLL